MYRICCVVLLLVIFPHILSAEPVTADRIQSLSADERAAWEAYLQRSADLASVDQAALDAELAAHQLPQPLAAPNGGDFKLSHKPGDPWYASDEAQALAQIVISYQTPAGGWSKHTGYAKGPRQPGMLFSSQYKPGAKPHYVATFDNRATTEQLHFLANLWEATKKDAYRDAFVRGLDYILAAQYPSGGWPQVFPLQGGYHDNVTFNDDAMTHILNLLKSIDDAEPRFAFINEEKRGQVSAALAAGVKYLLAAQIEVGGKKTVWCAQHDPITRAPQGARAFEPAALSGMESARVIEFLMRYEKPSPEIVAAIESGLAWFESARVTGIARVKRDGKTTYEPDPNSTEVYWARFYDLTDGQPIFPARDNVVYRTYAEMAKGNDIGYDYYTTLPNSLVTTKQKKWRQQHRR